MADQTLGGSVPRYPDLRTIRANQMAHAVLHEILRFVPHECYTACNRALFKVFREFGFEAITDVRRAELGLPPRGPDGWTAEELAALDHARLDEITRPPPIVFVERPTASMPQITTHTPTPWRIERQKNTATVMDATGQPIPHLSDLELGWADTTTGPYHDPESDFAWLQELVATMNGQPGR